MVPSPSEDTTEEKTPPSPLFFVDDLWPCYMTTDHLKIEDIKDLSLPICYVLTNVDEKDGNTTKRRPALLKMMNGDFGYSLVETPFKDLGMTGKAEVQAAIKLPKLPWQLIEELDLFFRTVFDKIGTESIVVLTYDMDKRNDPNPSSGWSYYVPTQKNTSGDCTYEKDEVLGHIEGTNLMLAGTVHSHPEMSAFASHTDEGDQRDWDGLHITFGWPKNGSTDYHIEMILDGASWTYKPHQVFEMPPPPKLEGINFDDVMVRVTKETPKYTHHGASSGYGGGSQQVWNHQVGGGTSSSQRPYSHSGPVAKIPVIHLPKDAPDPRAAIIVAVMLDTEMNCRMCGAPVTARVKESRRCYACASFLISPEMDLEDLIRVRDDLKQPSSFLKLDPDIPIYFWSQKDEIVDGTEQIIDVFDHVAGPLKDEALKK